MHRADDFSKPVQPVVAERAAYICSNPGCRCPTIQPHSDPMKSLKTGIAAHIRAAEPGGPRYDAGQTAEERRSIHNAIWLCTTCSTAIDKDESRYPVETLLQWKSAHEEWLREGGIVPAPPDISINTLNGFTVPDAPAKLELRELADLREHQLTVQNSSDGSITIIDARLQLPEPVVAARGVSFPPGIEVDFRPVRPQMIASTSGGGTVTRNRPPLPSQNVRLGISSLPPRHPVVIHFYTSLKSVEGHELHADSGPFAELRKGPYLLHFIDGTFQFQYRGATITKRFFAPLAYDPNSRRVRLFEVRGDIGEYKPVETTFWS